METPDPRFQLFEYRGMMWHFAVLEDTKADPATPFLGALYRNKPTPSGCMRLLLQSSDKRRFPTIDAAYNAFIADFNEGFVQASKTPCDVPEI